MSKTVKFIETKSIMVVTRASGGGKEEISLTGDDVSVLQKWKILESDYAPMWIYLTQLYRLWWNLLLMGRKHGGEGRVREFGMDWYTLLYVNWISNKHLLYSMGNSAQCYVAVWIRGDSGREWTHVCVCWVPLLISYPSVWNKKLKR